MDNKHRSGWLNLILLKQINYNKSFCNFFKELGKRIYLAGLEVEGLLTSQNYKSSAPELNVLPKSNPFYSKYPVSKEIESLLPKSFLENCSCSDAYMRNDYFSVNIYEAIWIKYNTAKSHPISNYIKNYLPIYTKMHYENKFLKSKKQNSK